MDSLTLRTLHPPLRVLLTCFLLTMGLGYLAAAYYLFSGSVDPHRRMGMSLLAGVTAKYYGDRSGSRLESGLRSMMSARLAPQEREAIIAWVRRGASREGFGEVKSVLDRNCVTCHNRASGLPVPPLTNFEEVKQLAQVDTGPTLAELARVSHIHLFGISFIFLLTGGIFVLSDMGWKWRAFIVALPFLTIWADIGAWWVTKYQPWFAWVVVISGALMGLALAVQILVSLWQMWWPLRVTKEQRR
jgi:hypothetical protein